MITVIHTLKVKVLSLSHIQPFCDPMDCCLPGSSVHGLFQARVLGSLAISFSRGLPDSGIEPCSPTLQADALPSEPLGKPIHTYIYTHTHTHIHTHSCSYSFPSLFIWDIECSSMCYTLEPYFSILYIIVCVC